MLKPLAPAHGSATRVKEITDIVRQVSPARIVRRARFPITMRVIAEYLDLITASWRKEKNLSRVLAKVIRGWRYLLSSSCVFKKGKIFIQCPCRPGLDSKLFLLMIS